MKASSRVAHVGLADALTKGPPPPGNLAVPIFRTVRSWLSFTRRLAATRRSPIREMKFRLTIAALAPFAVVSAFTILSRWPSYRPTPVVDWLGLAIGLLVGVGALATLPRRPRVRIVSVALYVPVIAVLWFDYVFWIVGLLFGEFL